MKLLHISKKPLEIVSKWDCDTTFDLDRSREEGKTDAAWRAGFAFGEPGQPAAGGGRAMDDARMRGVESW